MMHLLTAAQCRNADMKAIEEYGIPSLSLMEEAACRAASILMDRLDPDASILFAAGCGNNGGDALAIARIMYTHGYGNIRIMLNEGSESADRALQRSVCQRLGIRTTDDFQGCDCIVDGLLGAGLRGPVRQKERALIDGINGAACPLVVSLDVPSGICDDACCDRPVEADLTITFGADKSSLHALGCRRFAGDIEPVRLSYPPDVLPASKVHLAGDDDYHRLELECDDYKTTRGRVAVIGGSRQYMGAMRLASKAAFKAGAGMVTLFTEPSLVEMAALDCGAGVMVRPFSDFGSLASTFDCVLAGPGLGQTDDAKDMVEQVCSASLRSLVLDADAIRLYPGKCNASRLVLTPHVGEYRALGGLHRPLPPDAFYAELCEIAARSASTIVLKAECVYVCDGEEVSVVDGLDPSLGVAGSGDVLAGIMAAILASGRGDVLDAVLLHQAAGRSLHGKAGYYSADELVDEVGVLR